MNLTVEQALELEERESDYQKIKKRNSKDENKKKQKEKMDCVLIQEYLQKDY